METKPGTKTSEFKLASLVIVIGLGLDVTAVLLQTLTEIGVSAPWFTQVLAVLGTLSTLVAALGYTRSRTLVKLQTQAPAFAAEVRSDIPLGKELLGTLQELKEEVRALKAKDVTPATLPSAT